MQESGFLRPVGDGEVPTRRDRGPSRPRAGKALPTDRLKFDIQIEALRAFAIASDFGRQPVTTDDLARYLPVSAATAGLNNMFFLDSDLIIRSGGKGNYLPTDSVCAFARKFSFDQIEAGKILADRLCRTWYYDAVRRRAQMGPLTRSIMIEVLADIAEATIDHKASLDHLLNWLEFGGLISFDGDTIVMAPSSQIEPVAETELDPADPEVQKPTTPTVRRGRPQASAALSFAFDLTLTADDLAKLTSDQIAAVFEAVGKVMAIRSSLGD